MFREGIEKVAAAGSAKAKLAEESIIKYLLAAILAGMFVGIGILLIFSIGGQLGGAPYTKLVMGASFGIALSLVVMAGSELFTGNNFVMMVSFLEKKVSGLDVARVFILSFIGNLIGSALIAFLFVQAGLIEQEAIFAFMTKTSVAKTTNSFSHLIFAGILCNILVCLAVWCATKMTSESGKLMMIWWCLFAFITSSYEHSIANMTLFSVTILGGSLTLSAAAFNILWVTLGNMIGGLLLGWTYYYIASTRK